MKTKLYTVTYTYSDGTRPLVYNYLTEALMVEALAGDMSEGRIEEFLKKKTTEWEGSDCIVTVWLSRTELK
jgi:hypothetical protein